VPRHKGPRNTQFIVRKYGGYEYVWIAGGNVRRFSEREIREFKAGIQRIVDGGRNLRRDHHDWR
jgi:hypothetical protein